MVIDVRPEEGPLGKRRSLQASSVHNANWWTAASVQNGGSQEGPNHAGLSTVTSV